MAGMGLEEEGIATTVMAEEAAEKARKLIRALHGPRHALDIQAAADAAAEGARSGSIMASKQLSTISRKDADMYSSAAASGAAAATLVITDNYLKGACESSKVSRPIAIDPKILYRAAVAGGRAGELALAKAKWERTSIPDLVCCWDGGGSRKADHMSSTSLRRRGIVACKAAIARIKGWQRSGK